MYSGEVASESYHALGLNLTLRAKKGRSRANRVLMEGTWKTMQEMEKLKNHTQVYGPDVTDQMS